MSQWSWFLRNHDEIDLDRLTDSQRNFVYRQFGPDRNMQLYDRGIRRRLAPMLHNPRQLEMAYSLLFSLPGTPELHYGEELGMGDDLSLQERLAVRTPMPSNHEQNAGFTTSDRPIRPLVKGEFGFARLNVADEEVDGHSLLTTVRRLAMLRKECPEIGLGRWSIPDSSNPHLLVLRYDFEGRALLIIHNFSSEPQQFSVPADMKPLHELINGLEASPGRPLALPAYGYRWFRIKN